VTKSCFLCSKKIGFMDDTFGKYALSKGEYQIPKGFGDEDVICYDCFNLIRKLEQPKQKESKPEPKDTFVFKNKQSTGPLPSSESNTIWILPTLLGVIGGVIMYLLLKDEDKDRAQHGLDVGIIVGVISFIIGIFLYLTILYS